MTNTGVLIDRITDVSITVVTNSGEELLVKFDLNNIENEDASMEVTTELEKGFGCTSRAKIVFPFSNHKVTKIKKEEKDLFDSPSEILDEFLSQFSKNKEM